MLQVYKGRSVKGYENVFFRSFAKTLSNMFELHNIDGLLLGMPQCRTEQTLQIDCLLITARHMIIIDFKNYSGTITLPEHENFQFGEWVTSDGGIVKGGSAPNPFIQQKKQRRKLTLFLEQTMPSFERNTLSSLVCFQHKVTIERQVPPTQQIYFAIVDATTYAETIFDLIDTVQQEAGNYLSEAYKKLFLQELFQASPYVMEAEQEEQLTVTEQPIQKFANVNRSHLDTFLRSNKQILMIEGNTKSGKTSHIPLIRELAFAANFKEVPVFAYSNRFLQNMQQALPEEEDIESLFGEIFDFSASKYDEFYRKIVPAKANTNEEERIVYVVDDAQLVTNTPIDDELLFGSGRLLEDFFHYVDLAAHPSRKVIFIGDPSKLNYGNANESALNVQYVTSMLAEQQVHVEVERLKVPNRTGHPIVQQCNDVAACIQQGKFHTLTITPNEHVHICDQTKKLDFLKKLIAQPKDYKLLMYENAKVNDLNKWLKERMLKNGTTLQRQDYIMFQQSIEAIVQGSDEVERINNGTFGEITRMDVENEQVYSIAVNNDEIVLRFMPCYVQLNNGVIVYTYVFLNYLYAEKNKITSEERVAYEMVLNHFKQELYDREPFEQSYEYKEMLRKNDYVAVERNGKMLYRQKDDARKLTTYEKHYRQRLEQCLLMPSQPYFQVLYAARIKYGWALTVNRAMASSFSRVMFHTDQGEQRGRTNKSYFKWLYTGMTIAKEQLYITNWQPITPLVKMTFNERLQTKQPLFIIATFSEDEDAKSVLTPLLQQYVDSSITWQSQQYAEIATIEATQSMKLKFQYNGKGEVRLPTLLSGDATQYEALLLKLKSNNDQIVQALVAQGIDLQPFIQQLQQQQVDVFVANTGPYQVMLLLEQEQHQCFVQLYYKQDGFITSCTWIHGTASIFNCVQQIFGNLEE